MKYSITARFFPWIFDRYAYAFFREKGLSLSKRKVRQCYRAMVRRTPALPAASPFAGNLLMGCYALSFWQAYPALVSEELFSQLVLALCTCRPMVNAHSKEDAFAEKVLLQKEKDAVMSESSSYEMDWQFRFVRRNNEYDLTYTRCGLCQLGRRENCFHLIRHLCEADFITYTLMGAELTRTKTLANGDDCCDFRVKKGLTQQGGRRK